MRHETRDRGRERAPGNGMLAFGAFAGGALAMGALAIGALAIWRLSINHLAVSKARVRDLEIDNLTIRNLNLLGPKADWADPRDSARGQTGPVYDGDYDAAN